MKVTLPDGTVIEGTKEELEPYNSPTKLTIEAAAMLRQAADAEEEQKLALVTIGNQSDEIAQLKARLEAVVKTADGLCDEVEFSMSWIDPKANVQHINERIAAYRAARGEGGAE